MKVDDFRALNPAFNRPVILGAGGGAQLLLPATKVERFQANLAAWESTGQPLASWTTYKTTASDTLTLIAKRAGISEELLREANQIPPRYRLAQRLDNLDSARRNDGVRHSRRQSRWPILASTRAREPAQSHVSSTARRHCRQCRAALESTAEGCDCLESPDIAKSVRRSATRADRAFYTSTQPRRQQDDADSARAGNDSAARSDRPRASESIKIAGWVFSPASAC